MGGWVIMTAMGESFILLLNYIVNLTDPFDESTLQKCLALRLPR